MALQSLFSYLGCSLGFGLGFSLCPRLRGPHLGPHSRPPTFRSLLGSRTKGKSLHKIPMVFKFLKNWMMIAGCRWTDERHCCSCRHCFESHLFSRWNAENGSLTDFLSSWSFFYNQKTSDRLQYYMEEKMPRLFVYKMNVRWCLFPFACLDECFVSRTPFFSTLLLSIFSNLF